MRKINILFLIGIILYGCESNTFDNLENHEAINAKTRTADINYNFGSANFSESRIYEFDPAGGNLAYQNWVLFSYTVSDSVNTNITPEVIDAPSWCNVSLAYESMQYFIYDIKPSPNAGSDRYGSVSFRQPGSNKTLIVHVRQHSQYNRIHITMKEIYPNRPLFTAVTDYPVREEVRCYIPYEVYNDGGRMESQASIAIAKGENTGTFVMDFNGSPLVTYYGNIRRYKLYEGSFGGDTVYTYSFSQYW